jgi:hypothetical protein
MSEGGAAPKGARTIDAALGRHDKVIVRILQGNHDEL